MLGSQTTGQSQSVLFLAVSRLQERIHQGCANPRREMMRTWDVVEGVGRCGVCNGQDRRRHVTALGSRWSVSECKTALQLAEYTLSELETQCRNDLSPKHSMLCGGCTEASSKYHLHILPAVLDHHRCRGILRCSLHVSGNCKQVSWLVRDRDP